MMFFFNKASKSAGFYQGLKSWLQFHGHEKFATSGNNLMICCPYHGERNPSLGVIVDKMGNGKFQCFSCEAKGGISKLIRYYEPHADTKSVKDIMKIGSPVDQLGGENNSWDDYYDYESHPESWLDSYAYNTPYWSTRRINNESVVKFKLGFDPNRFAAVIPVRHFENRKILGACFRFWDSHPMCPENIKNSIQERRIKKYIFTKDTKRNLSFFGLETMDNNPSNKVFLFEGAIDAMTHWQCTGLPSLASWGTRMNQKQLEFLRKNFAIVDVVVDNDINGAGLLSGNQKASMLLAERIECRVLRVDERFKDYNECFDKTSKVPQLIEV